MSTIFLQHRRIWKPRKHQQFLKTSFAHEPPGHTCGLPCCNNDLHIHLKVKGRNRGCMAAPGLDFMQENFTLRRNQILRTCEGVGGGFFTMQTKRRSMKRSPISGFSSVRGDAAHPVYDSHSLSEVQRHFLQGRGIALPDYSSGETSHIPLSERVKVEGGEAGESKDDLDFSSDSDLELYMATPGHLHVYHALPNTTGLTPTGNGGPKAANLKSERNETSGNIEKSRPRHGSGQKADMVKLCLDDITSGDSSSEDSSENDVLSPVRIKQTPDGEPRIYLQVRPEIHATKGAYAQNPMEDEFFNPLKSNQAAMSTDYNTPTSNISLAPPPPNRPLPKIPESILKSNAKSTSLPARVSFDESVDYGRSRYKLDKKLQERKRATERALAWVWNDGEIPRSSQSSAVCNASNHWLLDTPGGSDTNSRSPVAWDSELSFREYDELTGWANPAFDDFGPSNSQDESLYGKRKLGATHSLQSNPITLIL